MLIHKLKFNPHVVWHKDGGFHVFGYINNHYHYLRINDGFTRTWERSQVPGIYQHTGQHRTVYHFNKVISNEKSVILIRHGIFGVFTDDNNLRFVIGNHHVISDTFTLNGFNRSCGINGVPYVPCTANFDQFGTERVFAWGDKFLYENNGETGEKRMIQRENSRESGYVSFTDAKFSPSGDKIALSVKDGIRFLNPQTLETERELSMEGHKVHFMSYSQDGYTLGAITTCRKLIIWDVD